MADLILSISTQITSCFEFVLNSPFIGETDFRPVQCINLIRISKQFAYNARYPHSLAPSCHPRPSIPGPLPVSKTPSLNMNLSLFLLKAEYHHGYQALFSVQVLVPSASNLPHPTTIPHRNHKLMSLTGLMVLE